MPNPKICTIFVGKPHGRLGGPIGDLITKKLKVEILAKLKAKFPQAEFLCREVIVKYEAKRVEELVKKI